MQAYGKTDIGPRRPTNEDCFRLPRAGEKFVIVADGMGGHQAGEVASSMAVEAFAAYMNKPFEGVEAQMRSAMLYANGNVFRASQTDPGKAGMGTTLTALYLDGADAYIAHVGDTRVYLMRNKAMVRITEDHTLVEQLVMAGKITPAEARIHPQRNLITRSLGNHPMVEVDVMHLDNRPGDVWLLCSDGLSNHLTERAMGKILHAGDDWQSKVDRLVEMAIENGTTDNITCVIVTNEEEHR